jgi:hypothetical protein
MEKSKWLWRGNLIMNVFDKFLNITGKDIQLFFEKFIIFSSTDYQKIINFITLNANLPSDSILKLEELIDEVEIIKNCFFNFKDMLSINCDFWELLDSFEDVSIKLDTVKNSSKWSRSIKNLTYSDSFEKEYILKQHETLEELASNIGYDNPDDDWINLAINNGLNEEDYDINGGTLLRVSFKNNGNYQVKTVLGSSEGEKVYGLDLNKKIIFLNNDLLSLNHKETLLQTTDILLNLYKGDNPEYREDGVDKGLIGSSINALQYPVLFRQLINLFSKDDSYESIFLNNIKREDDINWFVTGINYGN